MSKEEMAKLLEGMLNDGEIAGRVADGDFADLGEGELTEAERALLTAAGSDLNDAVVGFGNYHLKLGDIDGESKDWKVEVGSSLKIGFGFEDRLQPALDHLGKAIFKF